MSYKHLLVHVDSGKRAPERIRLAAKLARAWGAHLTGLFAESGSFGRSVVASRSPQQFAKAEKAAAAEFDAVVKEARLEREWWQIGPTAGDVGEIAAQYCRYVDLAILGQPDPHDPRVPEGFASEVVLQSGRPVLLVPWAGSFDHVGRRVLVAWNRSREGTRALHDAMPFLRAAEKVLVVAFQAPHTGPAAEGAKPNIVRHLAANGIAAEYHPAFVENGSVGKSGVDVFNTVLNLGSDFGADLVVMGARGRTGFPFSQLASTTERSLRSMIAPVLLSH